MDTPVLLADSVSISSGRNSAVVLTILAEGYGFLQEETHQW